MSKLLWIALAAVFGIASCTAPSCTDDPNGTNYSGNLAKTLSGRTCQSWTSQCPHEHSYTPSEYPNAGLGDHNYCRNPGSAFTAWCYTNDVNVRWEYCAIGNFSQQCTNPECYTAPSGSDYRGNLAQTQNGRTCQKWTSQEPQSHTRTSQNYPDAGLGDHNLCRNPDDSDFAWCYTTDESVRWEYCNIGLPSDSC